MLTGGTRDGEPGYFVEPTIFADTRPDMTIVSEKIFGPVAALARFGTDEEAIAQGDATEFGLSATVWTRDASRVHRMGRALKAGTVWITTMFDLDPASPFGGYKSSGAGRELGTESIDGYTQVKSVYVGA